MNPLQALGALVLAFVLPGFFLVKAVFPRHRFSRDLHGLTLLFLTLTLSVTVTILVTGALAAVGRFEGAATGAPLIEASLAGVTLVLAVVAVLRGAFPRVYGTRSESAAPARGRP